MSYFRKSWGCAREPGLEPGSRVALEIPGKPEASCRKNPCCGNRCPFSSLLCRGSAGSMSLLKDFVAKKIRIDTLDRTALPHKDAYRHA